MTRLPRFTIELLAVLMLCGCSSAMLGAALEVPVTRENFRPVAGDVRVDDKTVSINGRVYDGAVTLDKGYWTASDFVTVDTRGYDCFQAYVGYLDGKDGPPIRVSVEVDGQQTWHQELRSGDAAIPIHIPLTGHRSMRLACKSTYVAFAEPKWIKGQPSPPPASVQPLTGFKCGVCGKTFDLIDDRDAHVKAEHGGGTSAAFIVDPNDLDKLATALRAAVDAKPQLKTKVDNGDVALMSFTLVDIASQSVATNVAEDLYTAMIKRDFPLVERGQLDKILKELKIQDTGLIDPATAQKIGQLSGCDIIVVGSISDRGTFVVINSRLLDTSTGKALTAERVEMRKVVISR